MKNSMIPVLSKAFRYVLSYIILFETGSALAAQRYKSALDAKNCIPVSVELMSKLPDAFQRFPDFVKECRLDRQQILPPVYIISVWIEEVVHKNPAMIQQEVPLPIIVKQNGGILGKLQASFPSDPPLFTNIQIEYSSSGWPTKIWQKAQSDSLGAPPKIQPQVWDRNNGQFVDK